jgi:hypothetical protein
VPDEAAVGAADALVGGGEISVCAHLPTIGHERIMSFTVMMLDTLRSTISYRVPISMNTGLTIALSVLIQENQESSG